MVLEAKAESKNPLIGKEQARKYAKSQNCRFVMSNGNLHYLWDQEQGTGSIAVGTGRPTTPCAQVPWSECEVMRVP